MNKNYEIHRTQPYYFEQIDAKKILLDLLKRSYDYKLTK